MIINIFKTLYKVLKIVIVAILLIFLAAMIYKYWPYQEWNRKREASKVAGVSFCVYVYNKQPGVEINYKTGESKLSVDQRISY